MNSDLKNNNLNNNNNDEINMFNVHMFNVHMFNVHIILNSFKIIISDMIMYKHILLRLKIKFIKFIKLYTEL